MPTPLDPQAARGLLLGALALRQAESSLPWYDSLWLCQYIAALRVIEQLRPALRADFVAAFERLRTPLDFRVRKLDRVFDDTTMEQIRQTIGCLPQSMLKHREEANFGRLIVHNHAVFSELQKTLVPLVSDLAGEALEPSYNFLSLYRSTGVCQPHMDAPTTKWTLDLCIDQSDTWPIHFSQTVPWPEAVSYESADWEERIKNDPTLKFSSYELAPGEALWFSGSSQWHYRECFTGTSANGFCNLLFFHFLPEGLSTIVRPANWPALFGFPELAAIVGAPKAT